MGFPLVSSPKNGRSPPNIRFSLVLSQILKVDATVMKVISDLVGQFLSPFCKLPFSGLRINVIIIIIFALPLT